MRVHLVDGTYELFRYFFAVPSHRTADGREVAAVRGVTGSMLQLLEGGATHVAIATDHVVESFRNELFPGYKTGEGIDPDLFSQFGLLEEMLERAGFRVFAMVEHEADDGLATGAAIAAADPRVEEVWICTPDKDLGQCVGGRVVQFDRRQEKRIDADAVREKFGVSPASIPDYLALVGDDADGIPGLPGWGARSTATVLAHYAHLEDIPEDADAWAVKVRGAARLAETLASQRDEAVLYRTLATLVHDVSGLGDVDAMEWTGPAADFAAHCRAIDAPRLAERAERIAAQRAESR